MKRFIVIILALIIIGGAIYFVFNQYMAYNNFQSAVQPQVQKEESKQLTPREEDQKVLVQLETIILLPDGAPTMAVITDINVLKQSQPVFFAHAKNGDRVIIYPSLAIIYDYEANKIINVGPVQTVQEKTATSTKNN